ncbi:MAG: NAD(P)-dependent oxidoreductase [Candidatus Eremiobacteraeota bacterium]|nr:NAD(P)-dependent oxidoreductase [Candidatus Eremiobacteraeota bacterium]MCW5868965.1 NAD(P)-dependent oxidoreductase [Candidatus Eremiobacteraeota bacterium]
MRVLITGVSGFIGQALAQHFLKLGHEVLGTSTREGWGGISVGVWKLGESLPPELLENVDLVVHAVYDPTIPEELAVAGGAEVIRQAHAAGVRCQLLISTLTAKADSASPYGRQKHRLEQYILAYRGIVVRPGLVVGSGGLFGRLDRLVRRCFVVPVVGDGRHSVYFIGLDELVEAISMLASRPQTGVFNLFHSGGIGFSTMLREIARMHGLRRWLLPMPIWLIDACLLTIELLKFPLGVRRENLLGLKQNSAMVLDSDLGSLGIPPRSFVEAYFANQRNERATKLAKS